MPKNFKGNGRNVLLKVPTGIQGFEEITNGGLPKGRSTLIVGGPGSGKTMFAMEFLVNGARKFDEPGVFISFEESEDDLIKNMASLGFDIPALIKNKKIFIDHVKVESTEIIETGDYDLEGLFVRIGYAIDSTGATRVALDTIESIFSIFKNPIVLRSEIRRLFQFLKDRGVTSIVTSELGERTITRNGLEEYVSDAVIVLDNRIIDGIATRRMRIIKYRGSWHGSNEYPFLIDEQGFSVLPVSSINLKAKATIERFSTGIPDLDSMLGGKGYFKGSSILISGRAGTGKTSIGMAAVKGACEKNKKALFITFEESPGQIIRNMRSIGIDLEPYVKNGLLRIKADRPTSYGLEMHLVTLHKIVNEFKPDFVILDPISSLMSIGDQMEVRSTMVRMVDFLKMNDVTTIFTDLKRTDEINSSMISSLVDTWILLEDVEANGETNRIMRIIKARGMAHSNQIREFHLTDKGIEILQPYIGPGGVLTGSARFAQESKDQSMIQAHTEEIERLRLDLEEEKKEIDAQIDLLRTRFSKKKAELERRVLVEERSGQQSDKDRRYQKAIRSSKEDVNVKRK